MRPALAYVAVAIGVLAAIVLARAAAVAYPLGDMAVIEVYAREALAGRLTVGPYSRFPWHHPGPLYFYLLAPVFAAGAQRSAALNAGALTIALASAGAVLWAARRSRQPYMALAVGVCLAVYVIRVDGLLVSAWNPHVVVLPAAAALLAAAGLAAGDAAMLPLVVAAASFAVQTDVALAPTMLAVAAAGLGFAAWRRQLSGRRLAVAAAILVVLWLPALLEQATGNPGNLRALWRFFVAGRGHGQTPRASLAAWAEALTALFRGGFALPTGVAISARPRGTVAGAVILATTTAAAAAAAFRARQREAALLAAVLSIASVAAYWSVTRIEDAIMDHQVFWISMVGALDAAAIVITVLTLAAPLNARAALARTAAIVAEPVIVIVLVVAGLGQMNRARLGSAPVTITLPSMERLGASIERYLAGRKALVRIDQDQWGVAAGIVLQLSRLGVRQAVEDDWAPMFPEGFRATGDEEVEIAIAASGDRQRFGQRPNDHLVDASSRIEVHAIPIGVSSPGAGRRP